MVAHMSNETTYTLSEGGVVEEFLLPPEIGTSFRLVDLFRVNGPLGSYLERVAHADVNQHGYFCDALTGDGWIAVVERANVTAVSRVMTQRGSLDMILPSDPFEAIQSAKNAWNQDDYNDERRTELLAQALLERGMV